MAAVLALVALLDRLGVPVALREPATSGKWDQAYFQHVTRHEGATSQHERDAARLVYGYSLSALLREAGETARHRADAAAAMPASETA